MDSVEIELDTEEVEVETQRDSSSESDDDHHLIIEPNRPPEVDDENQDIPLTNCDIPLSAEDEAAGWTKVEVESDHDTMCFDFVRPEDPLEMPHLGREPIDFFDAFMDKEMWEHIVDETNRYAACRLQKQGNDSFERAQHEEYRPRARLNAWKPLTLGELKVFVAHLIIMGLVRKPDIEMYWSGAPFTRTPFFGVYMSRDRFTAILSNLHVNDDTDNPPYPEAGHDPLAKIRNFIQMMDRNFLHVYKPERDISIDEGSMPWKGRLRFKQYNPSKPARFHVKLYQVCEAKSSYIIGYKIFTGSGSCHRDGPDITIDPEATTTTKTVLTLLDDCNLFHKGHSVFMDNFYNSVALLEELMEKETLGCGTVRSNRKGMPKTIVKANMKEPGQAFFARKKVDCLDGAGILFLKWVDKRPVHMLSSIHAATKTWTGRNQRNPERTPIFKPTVIVQYTKLMGGVDLSDQLMNYYNFLRRTQKWWRKLWVHLLNMIIHNAYVLNRKEGSNKKLAHYEFRESIAFELIKESRPETMEILDNDIVPTHLIPGCLNGRHFIVKIPKNGKNRIVPRTCKVCKITKTDQKKGKGQACVRYTTFICEQCKLPMCASPCFKLYHTEADYRESIELILPD
jgi:hypothetical protein